MCAKIVTPTLITMGTAPETNMLPHLRVGYAMGRNIEEKESFELFDQLRTRLTFMTGLLLG